VQGSGWSLKKCATKMMLQRFNHSEQQPHLLEQPSKKTRNRNSLQHHNKCAAAISCSAAPNQVMCTTLAEPAAATAAKLGQQAKLS
jgi:hypothetical protein